MQNLNRHKSTDASFFRTTTEIQEDDNVEKVTDLLADSWNLAVVSIR